MNYIINPSWFYWISVSNALKTISAVFFVLSVVAFMICFAISAMLSGECAKDNENYLFAKKIRNVSGIILAVSAATIVFVPSKNTLIEMMIAKYATYDNAAWTLDTIKSAVDYIVNAIQSVK